MSTLSEIELYKMGMSTRDVANAVGASVSAVRYRLEKAGVMRDQSVAIKMALEQGKTVKADAELMSKAKAMLDKGALKRDIAKQLGVHRHTLRKAFRLHGPAQHKPANDERMSYEEFKRIRDSAKQAQA